MERLQKAMNDDAITILPASYDYFYGNSNIITPVPS